MNYDVTFNIGQKKISLDNPTYFIADIAANHDGDIERAKDLIWKSKEAGADCAKFQHFIADKIVSDVGFSEGVGNISHQASWKKSVSEIYEQYHTRREWTDILVQTCKDANIEFMTTPYDLEAVDMFESIVPAYKVGSGDLTFHSQLLKMAQIGKPILLATGASTMREIENVVDLILKHNKQLCLMQCNTNYTGSPDNFKSVNLRVLQSFSERWPGMVLGFSDHTPGHNAVLGSVTLGARVIEKHFTDDTTREGPDHSFAMDPHTWADMITATRELESSLGDGIKRVESNELETVIIQRRCLRAKEDMSTGTIITKHNIEALRPCPEGALPPYELQNILGKKLRINIIRGREILWEDLD